MAMDAAGPSSLLPKGTPGFNNLVRVNTLKVTLSPRTGFLYQPEFAEELFAPTPEELGVAVLRAVDRSS